MEPKTVYKPCTISIRFQVTPNTMKKLKILQNPHFLSFLTCYIKIKLSTYLKKKKKILENNINCFRISRFSVEL